MSLSACTTRDGHRCKPYFAVQKHIIAPTILEASWKRKGKRKSHDFVRDLVSNRTLQNWQRHHAEVLGTNKIIIDLVYFVYCLYTICLFMYLFIHVLVIFMHAENSFSVYSVNREYVLIEILHMTFSLENSKLCAKLIFRQPVNQRHICLI